MSENKHAKMSLHFKATKLFGLSPRTSALCWLLNHSLTGCESFANCLVALAALCLSSFHRNCCRFAIPPRPLVATWPTGSDIRISCARKVCRRWPKNEQEKRAHAYDTIHLRSVCAVRMQQHWLQARRFVQRLQSVVPMLWAQEEKIPL